LAPSFGCTLTSHERLNANTDEKEAAGWMFRWEPRW
jgi:hypothetical protein